MSVSLSGHGLAPLPDLSFDTGFAHAQGADDLSLSGYCFLSSVGGVRGMESPIQTSTAISLIRYRQGRQHPASYQGKQTDRRVQQETAQQVDRRPWRIKHGQRTLPGNGDANIIELPQDLSARPRSLTVHDARKNSRGQEPIQP